MEGRVKQVGGVETHSTWLFDGSIIRPRVWWGLGCLHGQRVDGGTLAWLTSGVWQALSGVF